MSEKKPEQSQLPKSLEGHQIPQERLDAILPHVAVLAAAALKVSDTLALSADASDFIRELEREAR